MTRILTPTGWKPLTEWTETFEDDPEEKEEYRKRLKAAREGLHGSAEKEAERLAREGIYTPHTVEPHIKAAVKDAVTHYARLHNISPSMVAGYQQEHVKKAVEHGVNTFNAKFGGYHE